MKYGVNRQVLLITAGIVWIVAGAIFSGLVLSPGLMTHNIGFLR